ncbi:hypothetical protein [Aureimonas sp. ME7]|uniref:hypothetical protein n=1 Tax=Aureimonas sp. ME7 TaxID=2744252 RepID=UPI0015F71FC6|nr:hypothetical protein [Aureimonas sp. ME7]
MTSLASHPIASPTLGPRPSRFGRASEWSLADWLVGTTSVMLAIGSAGFFVVSYVISIQSPDYFQNAALSRIPPKLDQIQTGSVGDPPDAMPAPVVVRVPEPTASDYQIVMIFQDEALLATRDELVRVKVGSVVPGLGAIQSIDGSSLGGTVAADKATLRSATAPGS